jgi:hypothetical protein
MGYIDPGLFGMISQMGLAVFLVLVSVFMFFFNPIKKLIKRLFKNKESSNPPSSPDSTDQNIQ